MCTCACVYVCVCVLRVLVSLTVEAVEHGRGAPSSIRGRRSLRLPRRRRRRRRCRRRRRRRCVAGAQNSTPHV